MIRPFDWRDIALLHRVRNQGLCLDSQLAFTRGPHTLQNAVIDALTPGRSTCTLVDRPNEDGDEPSLGQFISRGAQHHARLTYISPVSAFTQPGGLKMLEALSKSAGERGLHALIAEVDEDSQVFETLRRAGFGTYARQRIWRLASPPRSDVTPVEGAWHRQEEKDNPAIQSLYHNLVPALVQQVEAPPSRNLSGLVHSSQDELLAYLDLHRGPRGVWVQPYFHPAAEIADELLADFFHGLAPDQEKPLFLCVRSYQGGLGGSFERLGLEPFCDQAVMVKRLAAPVRQTLPSSIPALEGKQPEPTVPYAQFENQQKVSGAPRKS